MVHEFYEYVFYAGFDRVQLYVAESPSGKPFGKPAGIETVVYGQVVRRPEWITFDDIA